MANPKTNIQTKPHANGIEKNLVSYVDKKTRVDVVNFSTTLTFDRDKDIYADVTGQSPVFTLSSSANYNGIGIILRLNKPTAVTFPGNFEASSSSAAVDSTKLNVFTLVYFSNWNGSGIPRVIYTNSLFTAQ